MLPKALIREIKIVDKNAIDAITEYLRNLQRSVTSIFRAEDSSFKVTLLEAEIFNSKGERADLIRFMEPFSLRMLWQHNNKMTGIAYAIRVTNSQGRFVFAVNTLDETLNIEDEGYHQVYCQFPNMLVPGDYFFTIGSYIRPYTTISEFENCIRITINNLSYQENKPFNIIGNPIIAVEPTWKQVS